MTSMKALIGINGIRTGENTWTDVLRLKFYKDNRFYDDIYIEFYYGYLPAIISILPWVRSRKAKSLQKSIEDIKEEFPEAKVSIVCHSLGSLISYYAIKELGIKIDKWIIFSGVVPRGADIPKLLENVGEIHNFWSTKDWVTKWNPFGKCGHSGFQGKHERLKQYKYPFRHGEWFEKNLSYETILNIVEGKTSNEDPLREEN